MGTVSGLVLASTEWEFLKSHRGESIPGYCERFQREVIEAAYPGMFDRFFQPTALETMEAFHGTPYLWWSEGHSPLDTNALQAGDVVFKDAQASGPFGHVGMVLGGGGVLRIGENSHYHVLHPGYPGNVYRALGWRYLSDFGPIAAVVRLSLHPDA